MKRDSAEIDGSQKIASDKGHRDIQRFASPNDPDYQGILSRIKKWVNDEKGKYLGIEKEKTKEQNGQLF